MAEKLSSGIKVLMIEDNYGDVLLIKEYLDEDMGAYELSTAETLNDGIEDIINNNYELILLDLGLPDSDGLKTFKEVFKNAKNIPIIVLTGLNDEELAEKTVSIGAQDYLLKGELNSKTLSKSIKYSMERKKIEIKLRESEQKFRTVADFTYDWEYWVDPDGNSLYVSPSCERISGYKPREFIENPDLLLEITHPDDRQILINHHKHVDSPITDDVEFRINRKDGKEIWISHNCQPVTNENGDFLGRRASNKDINDRKIAENSLKESEEKYRHVVETAAEGIALLDSNGTVMETNPKALEMIGFDKEEVIGKNIMNLTQSIKIDSEEVINTFRDVLMGKLPLKNEWEFVNKVGITKFVKANYSLMKKNGKTQGIALVIEDISELKIREKNLEESLSEKNALLKEVHHRVNNNMQIISSLLNLQTGFVNSEETKTVLKDTQSRLKSMAMIHEKLYISKDLSHINIREYTEKLVSDIFYTYGVRAGAIKSNLNVEEIELNMETAIPIGLIINELVTNSIKYAFPNLKKGTIRVELTKNDNYFNLTVADDGVGLPENVDYKDNVSLGLQLVNNLVKQIDGVIKLDRVHGTNFKINFKELEYKERMEG